MIDIDSLALKHRTLHELFKIKLEFIIIFSKYCICCCLLTDCYIVLHECDAMLKVKMH